MDKLAWDMSDGSRSRYDRNHAYEALFPELSRAALMMARKRWGSTYKTPDIKIIARDAVDRFWEAVVAGEISVPFTSVVSALAYLKQIVHTRTRAPGKDNPLPPGSGGGSDDVGHIRKAHLAAKAPILIDLLYGHLDFGAGMYVTGDKPVASNWWLVEVAGDTDLTLSDPGCKKNGCTITICANLELHVYLSEAGGACYARISPENQRRHFLRFMSKREAVVLCEGSSFWVTILILVAGGHRELAAGDTKACVAALKNYAEGYDELDLIEDKVTCLEKFGEKHQGEQVKRDPRLEKILWWVVTQYIDGAGSTERKGGFKPSGDWDQIKPLFFKELPRVVKGSGISATTPV